MSKEVVADCFCVVGISIVSYGLWILHPSAMLICVGVCCVVVGIRLAMRK